MLIKQKTTYRGGFLRLMNGLSQACRFNNVSPLSFIIGSSTAQWRETDDRI